MTKIGFIGAYDKIDLILYIAKILTLLKKRVLIIDTTLNQKAKYIVPAINPTLTYITEFEDIDVAVGFNSMEEIIQYLCLENESELEYDIALIDADSPEKVESFELENANRNYFVTSFDNYSLKKGLEALVYLKDEINLTKVLFSRDALKEEDDYLNFLALPYKIVWNEHRLYFPLENGDLSVIHENQRVAKIKFRKLSVQYKDGLAYLTEDILGDVSESNIRRVIKSVEKGM